MQTLSETTANQIIITDHTKKRLLERSIDKELIIDCLTNLEIKGILEQSYNNKKNNKFKVFYRHPNRKEHDIIIVIGIDQNKNIKVITTYLQRKDRRVRK